MTSFHVAIDFFLCLPSYQWSFSTVETMRAANKMVFMKDFGGKGNVFSDTEFMWSKKEVAGGV